ncbi:potassium voltage-gated channel subfamily B member 2-like [Tachypleus tridentatus]|uniref:potassium voltage-gated channel subfamily B member 2-like n=1 Tax=Tachypleus tridentatus TaxID=6853 RepID=UPI003FD57EB5
MSTLGSSVSFEEMDLVEKLHTNNSPHRDVSGWHQIESNHPVLSVEESQYSCSLPISLIDINDAQTQDVLDLFPNDSVADLTETKNHRVTLNVGGVKHQVMWNTLKRFPQTRFGRLRLCRDPEEFEEYCDEYNPDENKFFFDHSPASFTSIINFYRTGKFHLLDELCVRALTDDFDYWMLKETCMEPCCMSKYYKKHESFFIDLDVQRFTFRTEVKSLKKESMRNIIASFSVFFILLSSITQILDTIPSLKEQYDEDVNEEIQLHKENKKLGMIEITCVVWFSIEYILRLFSAPNKGKFLKSILNIVDLLVITPFTVSSIVVATNIVPKDFENIHEIILIFRVARVMRILKLARHSRGLQSLGYTMKKSIQEFGLLILSLVISIVFFSSLAYFAEKDEPETLYTSIPSAFWRACVTMTTVGFEDMVPVTLPGKVIGSICCIAGVVVVGMPVPIIVNNFAEFYTKQKIVQRALVRKKIIEEAERANALPTPFSCFSLSFSSPRILFRKIKSRFTSKKY